MGNGSTPWFRILSNSTRSNYDPLIIHQRVSTASKTHDKIPRLQQMPWDFPWENPTKNSQNLEFSLPHGFSHGHKKAISLQQKTPLNPHPARHRTYLSPEPWLQRFAAQNHNKNHNGKLVTKQKWRLNGFWSCWSFWIYKYNHYCFWELKLYTIQSWVFINLEVGGTRCTFR